MRPNMVKKIVPIQLNVFLFFIYCCTSFERVALS